MNQTVVIYESKYGSTRRYAQWLAETLACPLFERKQFSPKYFAQYQMILYGGGLYAGGLSGVRLITQNWSLLSDKHVILFTCGLANPDDPDNIAHIREGLSKTLSAEMMSSIPFFHLRGGICYPGLSLVHRTMMAMLRRMLLKKAPSERSAEDQLLLATYGKTLDFTDRAALEPMLAHIRALQEAGSIG